MRSFAIYRLPFAEECTMLVQHSAPSELSSLTELDGKEGFVIAPFSPSADCPILLLQPDEVRTMPEKEVQPLAKKEEDVVKVRFYRTMAQLVASPHVKYHGLWAADFAITLINKMYPGDFEAVKKERLKQIELLKMT